MFHQPSSVSKYSSRPSFRIRIAKTSSYVCNPIVYFCKRDVEIAENLFLVIFLIIKWDVWVEWVL